MNSGSYVESRFSRLLARRHCDNSQEGALLKLVVAVSYKARSEQHELLNTPFIGVELNWLVRCFSYSVEKI